MTLNVKENIKTVSYFQANAEDVIGLVNERKEPVIISQNNELQAVLIDIETYQNMLNAFNLLKIIKFSETDVKNGRFSDANDVFSRLKQKYGVNE